MWALLTDYYRYGRAYAHVIARPKWPAEIQYLPAGCTVAVPDGNGRLLRYDYTPASKALPVDKRQGCPFPLWRGSCQRP